ncbi:myomegalin-like [Mustela erminea]|uniref:myomegalin-like n=1 Tax=Mustela erminea TaxID=36723 RepID=UPI001387523D|nr:myomegalin-like [Mustela erminea]
MGRGGAAGRGSGTARPQGLGWSAGVQGRRVRAVLQSRTGPQHSTAALRAPPPPAPPPPLRLSPASSASSLPASGKLLVKKIADLVRSACTFPGLETQGTEGHSLQRELLELRTRLPKQESVLQNTERLKPTNQQKESMQQFIFNQLTRTHDVLKKARTSLEVKSLRALPCTPVL